VDVTKAVRKKMNFAGQGHIATQEETVSVIRLQCETRSEVNDPLVLDLDGPWIRPRVNPIS